MKTYAERYGKNPGICEECGRAIPHKYTRCSDCSGAVGGKDTKRKFKSRAEERRFQEFEKERPRRARKKHSRNREEE